MPKFVVQEGYYQRGEIEIQPGTTVIGRDESCDLVIPDDEVSRQHARVVLEDGKATIEDLDSVNGTFLNNTPIREPQQLKHLDVLQMSGNVFVYHDSEAVERRREGHKTSELFTFEFLGQMTRRIEENVTRVFMGKPKVVRNVMLCILSDGHVLIEDKPGVGKTILAQSVAKSIQGAFKRIQFTPDMLPSDITGISVYNEADKDWRFMPGPIFGNVILADEINRTTPRTQSSLLECMAESMVTVDGKPRVLPKPFFVIATQNPAEFHGTYPLPEAQLDRFMMRLSIGYPEESVEHDILSSQTQSHPIHSITYVAKAMDLVQCQALVRQVHVSEPVKDYIIRIATATRQHPALTMGISPRASLALMRASQALAAYNGRRHVLPSDIRELAKPVLSHRLVLKLRAQAERETTGEVIDEILEQIPMDDEEVPTS